MLSNRSLFVAGLVALCLGLSSSSASAQSDLKMEELPGYAEYQRITRERGATRNIGRARDIQWTEDGKFLNFSDAGEAKSLNLETFELGASQDRPLYQSPKAPRATRRSAVPRAEQRQVEPSPDGKWKAVYRDNNVYIEPANGEGDTIAVTTQGTERLRYGTGCWVYGEELDQDEAMWWSPDGKRLVFYEVDEQGLKDYFLTINNTDLYTDLNITRYPKAGELNPQVNLMVYDRDTGKTKRLAIDGEPRQYLYNIRFAPSGQELLVNRTNRHQDVLDVLAIDPVTGTSRVVLTERQTTWQKNSPEMRFLDDGERFIWETEANGWKNYELRHMDGRLLNGLTQASGFPCERIVEVDEEQGYFYYTAYSDQNPYCEQLHRVRMDGTEDVRLTASPLHHSAFEFDPRGRFFKAERERVDMAPATVRYDMQGREVAVLSDGARLAGDPSALPTAELISFPSLDESVTLFGTLHFPSDFDPEKKYPLVIDVYGGPGSRGFSSNYQPNNPLCEFGFIVAKIGNRGTVGRGKAFESATYLQLGKLDLDDQVAGVKYLTERPYIDGQRVGIYGHSYGGYMSALAVLRYPEVFHVAVAGAPVTDWKNYDSIYTERYMRTPQKNADGYQQGSCMEYVEQLTGKLLIVHGLIDDNVHPANTWQLVSALQKADRRFDLMVYPGFKHGIRSNYPSVRVEYLYRHLIAVPPAVKP